MRITDIDILLVPGHGTSESHWVQRWQRSLKTAILIAPPVTSAALPSWVAEIIATAAARTRPTVVVAHGEGVAAIAAAANGLHHTRVIGALLVAPQIPNMAAHPGLDLNSPLDFATALIAPRNSPHVTFEQMTTLAQVWGADLVDAGAAGPIDETSGHGPWPEGLMRLGWLLKRIASTKTQ